MCSKKDYVAIAKIMEFRLGRASAEWSSLSKAETAKLIAIDLADYFASDNPRFDRHRFLEASGVFIPA